MLRNCLPSLRCWTNVFFDFEHGHWIVDVAQVIPGYKPYQPPLEVGMCPVYLADSWRETIPDPTLLADSFFIRPRAIAHDDEIRAIARFFKHSIGVRVFKYGQIHILYTSESDLKQELRSTGPLPSYIGNLFYVMKVVTTVPSCGAITGAATAGQPYELMDVRGALGIRMRPQGQQQDVWTTTTHAWLDLPRGRNRNTLANVIGMVRKTKWLSKAVDFVTSTAIGGPASASVLGQEVYLADSATKV